MPPSIALTQSIIAAKTRRHYLSLVWLMVLRELKVKYRGTVLGYAWSMLNPLLFMTVISFVFGHLVRDIPNYQVFVLAGILIWNTASHALNVGTRALTNNSALLTKIKVPFWVFPLVSIGFALANLALSIVPYLLVSLYYGIGISAQMLLLPFIVVLFSTFLLGLVLILSVANVFFRDIAHVLEPILTLIFYATPVIYNRTHPSIPERIAHLLGYNPFTHFVEAFRGALIGDVQVSIMNFIVMTGLATASLGLGLWVYKKNKSKIMFAL